jgi:hypothetical protein
MNDMQIRATITGMSHVVFRVVFVIAVSHSLPTVASAAEKCVSLKTLCPGKGWVISSCNEKNPCGTRSSVTSTNDEAARALGTALGQAMACKLFGQGCVGHADNASARANYYGLSETQRARLVEALTEQEAANAQAQQRINTVLDGGSTGGLSLRDLDTKGSGTDAGAQLKSVERHSRDAQEQTSKGKDTARETARTGFDTPGKASGNLVYPDKKQRQIPSSALDKRVPAAAQKDPQVQQSLAWYRKLDAEKAEKEKMIAEIKEQQKTSKDPVLETKIATLKNDVKRATDDQAKVTETVKKQVKNLGFNLVESTEPTTTEANKK